MDKYEHRRLRLMELKETACNGKTARLAEKIARSDSYVARMLYAEGKEGKKRIGDDMLEVIEKAFGLPRSWFDLPLNTPMNIGQNTALNTVAPSDVSESNVHMMKRERILWPFSSVTYERLMDIKDALGPKEGAAAMRDIDNILDVVATKWERISSTRKPRRQ